MADKKADKADKSPKTPKAAADPEVEVEPTETPDPVQERLNRIESLSDEELAGFQTELRELAEAVIADPQADIREADQYASDIETVRAEVARRESVQAEREAAAEEIRARIASPEAETAEPAPEPEAEPEADPVPAPEPAPEPDTEPVAPSATAPEPAVEPVAQRPAATISRIAARRPAARQPRPSGAVNRIVAGGDVQDFSAGQNLSKEQLAVAMANKLEAAQRMGTDARPGRLYVGTVQAQWPSDRKLGADSFANGEQIGKLIDTAQTMESLTASGGLCAPLEVSYDLVQISTRGRPVRDALGGFQARRGGVRWVTPPQLTSVEDAVALWTADNDANPTDPATKPCLVIDCGQEQTARIDAIPLCLQVGNFDLRTFPENFDRWYQLALAWHDRFAETNLLDKIGAASTEVIDGQNLGATRDLLESMARAAVAFRSRHRMAPEAPLTLLTPFWVADMMQADLAREMPGAPEDRLRFARSQIAQFFAVRNLRVSFYLDSETGEGQIFGAQAAGTLNPWPSRVVSYIFHPGAFIFLDGGTLDLGVEIRDSGLIETNDVRAFLETFEGLAMTGIGPLKLVNNVCVSGEASALATGPCSTGS